MSGITISLTDAEVDETLRLMERFGLDVSWWYPGMAAITIDRARHDDPLYLVTTGLNGWEYGSVSVLDEDSGWQPVEHVTAEPVFGEGTARPLRVALAWASWVAGFKAGLDAA